MTKKTKAILPVHLYGAPCNIVELRELATREKILLVEDAAQAQGTTYINQKVGTFGELGVFSFYPGKNLGAYGDGGGIATNDEGIYKKLLKIRNYGQSKKYHHDEIGINTRLDEIQAAVLLVKLRYLDQWNEARAKNASYYRKFLKNVKLQQIDELGKSNYHLFVIEHPNRAGLINYLDSKGIQTLIHYPIPIHLQKCYNYLGYNRGDFPIAERLADNVLSLPMYSELTDEEIKYIAEQVNSFR